MASYAADEAAVARALKDYDRDLRLVPQPSQDGPIAYQVWAYRGNDRPALHVLSWVTDRGEPLPLSMQLVEQVKLLDRNTRRPYLDADARNELRAKEQARQMERDIEAVVSDWEMKHGRPVLHRSVSLRMARDKRRARGEKC